MLSQAGFELGTPALNTCLYRQSHFHSITITKQFQIGKPNSIDFACIRLWRFFPSKAKRYANSIFRAFPFPPNRIFRRTMSVYKLSNIERSQKSVLVGEGGKDFPFPPAISWTDVGFSQALCMCFCPPPGCFCASELIVWPEPRILMFYQLEQVTNQIKSAILAIAWRQQSSAITIRAGKAWQNDKFS